MNTRDDDTDQVGDELAALLGPRGSDNAAVGSDAALPPELERMLAAERGARGFLRSRPTSQRVLLAAALVLAWAAAVLLATRRPDLGVMPIARLVLDVALLGTPIVAGLAIALRPVHRPALPPWSRIVLLAYAAIALLVFALLPMAHADHPASLAGVGDDMAKRAVGCFTFGSIFGVLTVLGLRMLSRGSGRVFVPTLAIAVASALTGALALYFHCPITHPIHLLLGHVPILLPPTVFALLARRRASD